MTKSRIARFGAVFAGAAMAVSFALPAAAATTAELQAQINALMAQLASLTGGSVSSGATFNVDLTVGSTGSDVVALQTWLVSKGFLTMPAGVAMGYFGNLTKNAVAAWQASAGITPSVGYFGPKSRAAVNAMAGTPTGPVTCPAGYTCTPPGGSTGGTITTPGVEGTMTVTSAPVSTGTLYEGDSMKDVLAFKVRAQTSDIAVQRVKLNLGTATTLYNKIYSRVYLVDDSGRTLASSDLNSSTVVKDGSNYYITLAGFSYVVARENTRTLTIKADVRSNIDSTDIDTETYTITLGDNGVRGVDGAGIDQYSPTTGSSVTKTISFSASLTESASLLLSTNANNPLAREVVASEGSGDNEANGVTLLAFDIKAQKDNVLLTDLVATVTRTNGLATASSTYLFVDGVQIGSASLSGSTATFSDIDYTIPKDTTKTFTLRADIRSATSVQTTVVASVANSGLTAENTLGDSVSKSGSATGNNVLVRNIGPIFSLVGAPTIVKDAGLAVTGATSSLTATFRLRIEAVGADVLLGDTGSTTGPLVKVDPTGTFQVYRDGSAVSVAGVASSTSAVFPSAGLTSLGSNTYRLSEGNSVEIPVTFTLQGRVSTGVLVTFGNYAVGISALNWVSTNGLTSSTFMAGLTEWRTPAVTLP